MAEFLKVIDRDDLVRDPNSKAVLSADLKRLHAHREKNRLFLNMKNQQQDVENLKKEVSEIKEILGKILTVLSDNK